MRSSSLNTTPAVRVQVSGAPANFNDLLSPKLPATVPSLARVEWERMQRVNSLTAGCDNLTHPKMTKLMFDGRGTLSGCGPHSHRYLLLSSAFR